jgi:hypothetical protein
MPFDDPVFAPTSARSLHQSYRENLDTASLSLAQSAALDRKTALLEKLQMARTTYDDKISAQHAGAAAAEALMSEKDPTKIPGIIAKNLKDYPDALASPAYQHMMTLKEKEVELYHAGEAKRAAATFNNPQIADIYNKANAENGPDFAAAAANAAGEQYKRALDLFKNPNLSPENRTALGDAPTGKLNWQDPKLLQRIEMQTGAAESVKEAAATIQQIGAAMKTIGASVNMSPEATKAVNAKIDELVQSISTAPTKGQAAPENKLSPADELRSLYGTTPPPAAAASPSRPQGSPLSPQKTQQRNDDAKRAATPSNLGPIVPPPDETQGVTPNADQQTFGKQTAVTPLPGGDELAQNTPVTDIPPGLEGTYHQGPLTNPTPPKPTPTPLPA